MKKWGCLLFIALAVLALFIWHPSARHWSTSHFETLAKEISSEGEFQKSLRVNPSGSELAYVRTAKGGVAIYLMDTKTGQERKLEVAETNRPGIDLYGYSSDGRYLLFSADLYHHIMVMDCADSSIKSVIDGDLMQNTTWLSSNSFCFNYGHTNFGEVVSFTSDKVVTNRIETGSEIYCITPIGSNHILYLAKKNIWLLDVDTGQQRELTPPANRIIHGWSLNDTHVPRWLNYSPELNEFLVCSWDPSDYRHLYKLTYSTNCLIFNQQTDGNEHTYNGQWIQKSKGFAFVGNQTNHFYLAVRPADRDQNTNLFVGGHVYGYTVSQDGDKIYAIASARTEPLGMWEYTISTRELRYIGGRAKLSQAETISAEERWVFSSDGTNVPYYVRAPKNLDTKKLYPAVIFLPVPHMQCFSAWEMFSQFFANAGVFHIAINHRGVDGYGKAYRRVGVVDADKDVDAVYEEIVKNPNIDKSRVFLMSFSQAGYVVNRTIVDFPGRWAGVINLSGEPPPLDEIERQGIRVFLFVGDRDAMNETQAVSNFEKAAKSNGVPITAMHDKQTQHDIDDSDVDRQLLLRLSDFIFKK
jgi:dipeptidyl aminopeptidase/acylaminoacyl peptidase